ncbi:MAG: hypothetical protein QOI37_1397 [Chloroflexota bacterium]|nr:hypothetical protein [Chloroflexota bacterium]
MGGRDFSDTTIRFASFAILSRTGRTLGHLMMWPVRRSVAAFSVALVLVAIAVAACAPPPPPSAARLLFDSLPNSIGGETLVYNIEDGPSIAADPSRWELSVLHAVGQPLSALTSATGFSSPALRYQSMIIRIAGTYGIDLIPIIARTFNPSPGTAFAMTIGGKQVTVVPPADGHPTPMGPYYYAVGNTVIILNGPRNLVDEALGSLP